MYLLKRHRSQGSGYVAKSNRNNSYTTSIKHARKFPTRAIAEANRCIESESIIPLQHEID